MNVALVRVVSGLLAIVALSGSAAADVVLSLTPEQNDVVVSPGGSTQLTIEVQLAAVSGTQQIQGYTIPVDLFDPLGTEPPPGFEVIAVSRRFDFQDGFFVSSLDPSEGDLAALDANRDSSFEFTTTPVTLFDFTVEISDLAASGNYTATVTVGNLFALKEDLVNSIPVHEITFQPATITVTAVPEPTGAVALCGMGGVVWLRNRRRRALRRPT